MGPTSAKAEAAQIIAVPAQTFRDWAVGYARKRLDGSQVVSAPIVTTLDPVEVGPADAGAGSDGGEGELPGGGFPRGAYWKVAGIDPSGVGSTGAGATVRNDMPWVAKAPMRPGRRTGRFGRPVRRVWDLLPRYGLVVALLPTRLNISCC